MVTKSSSIDQQNRMLSNNETKQVCLASNEIKQICLEDRIEQASLAGNLDNINKQPYRKSCRKYKTYNQNSINRIDMPLEIESSSNNNNIFSNTKLSICCKTYYRVSIQ